MARENLMVGTVVKLDGDETCWRVEVAAEFDPDAEVVEPVEVYDDCWECLAGEQVEWSELCSTCVLHGEMLTPNRIGVLFGDVEAFDYNYNSGTGAPAPLFDQFVNFNDVFANLYYDPGLSQPGLAAPDCFCIWRGFVGQARTPALDCNTNSWGILAGLHDIEVRLIVTYLSATLGAFALNDSTGRIFNHTGFAFPRSPGGAILLDNQTPTSSPGCGFVSANSGRYGTALIHVPTGF